MISAQVRPVSVRYRAAGLASSPEHGLTVAQPICSMQTLGMELCSRHAVSPPLLSPCLANVLHSNPPHSLAPAILLSARSTSSSSSSSSSCLCSSGTSSSSNPPPSYPLSVWINCPGHMRTCHFMNPKPRKEAAPNRCLRCCSLSVTTPVKALCPLCEVNTSQINVVGLFYLFTFRWLGLLEQDIE